jgi:hypothetical protein
MKRIKNILNVSLCIFILFSYLQCSNKTSSNCKPVKIQLLLEDVFKKKNYFPFVRNSMLIDSSMYFLYLNSVNLEMPEKDFYLHGDKCIESSFPDSVKLRVISNPYMKNKYSNLVGIELIEVNEDTTKLKILLGYVTANNIAIDGGTLSYSFDEENCKWILLDSTIERY